MAFVLCWLSGNVAFDIAVAAAEIFRAESGTACCKTACFLVQLVLAVAL